MPLLTSFVFLGQIAHINVCAQARNDIRAVKYQNWSFVL
jgi:hypothetical protein